MIAIENVNTYVTGVFPDAVADNSTGAATADGFEFIAEWINNSVIGNQQDWMDYAGLSPNGVTEAAGVSQIRSAIQLGNAIGPGFVSRRDIFADPSVHGDRSLLLTEQGILHAAYPELLAAVYVGDATNNAVAAAGGYYYKSTDAAGLTPNIAGTYLQLPPNPYPTGLRQYSEALTAGLAVTGLNWTTTRAVAIPYQTIDSAWRLIMNCYGVLSIATTAVNLTVSGITSKNIAGYTQAPTVIEVAGAGGKGTIAPNSSIIQCSSLGAASLDYGFSFNIELDSIPTWAKVFDIKHAITY